MLILDGYRSHVGGVSIDDVVSCLVHNEPLTCATEASHYVKVYSAGQEDYESGVVSDSLRLTTSLTLGEARLVPLDDRI